MIMRKRKLLLYMYVYLFIVAHETHRDIFDAMFSVRHSVDEIVIQQGCYYMMTCFHACFY